MTTRQQAEPADSTATETEAPAPGRARTAPTDRDEPTPERAYTVTYAFNGYLRGKHGEAISLITDTAERMHSEGIDISFLGATGHVNAAGQLIEVTARYAAPTEGTVGRLNCRACLPATGPPRLMGEEDRPAEPDRPRVVE